MAGAPPRVEPVRASGPTGGEQPPWTESTAAPGSPTPPIGLAATPRARPHAVMVGAWTDSTPSRGSAPGCHRLDLPALRAMLWAARALHRTRRALATHGLDGVRVTPAPPALPAHAVRGARFALRRMNASCLEGALVLQAWDAARGAGPDVVIGVIGTGEDFRAHAWLATAPDAAPGTFSEILRIPASRA